MHAYLTVTNLVSFYVKVCLKLSYGESLIGVDLDIDVQFLVLGSLEKLKSELLIP